METASNHRLMMPAHIGIIMDGNGRWAQNRGRPRSFGHKAGAENFKRITRYAAKQGLSYLTMYAFSTENWRRPATEISALMFLFKQYLQDALQNFLDENIKVQFLGDTTAFPAELQRLIQEVIEVSANRTGMVLNLAMNYGGRGELIRAIQRGVKAGISPQDLTEENISQYLDTAGQPDPDLIIRPSGEQRLSNFLIWQGAYAELLFMDVLWPDFRPEHFDQAVHIYAERQRRFGGV